MDDGDYTWENALMVASRWEEANHDDSDSSSSSSSSSDDTVEAVECNKKKKKEKVVINALEGKVDVASLAEVVKSNARDLKGVKREEEQMNANITSWKNETTKAINQLSANVSICCLQMSGANGSNQNPQPLTGKGSLIQNHKSGFRFNRNNSQNFKTTTSATAPTAITPVASPAAAATVATLNDVEPAAQLLGAEGGDMVTVPMDYFLDLHARAGEELCEEDFSACLSRLYRQ